MGIRFACPNGHPLHVKADLAGKRGICPECQARFLIPQPMAVEAAAQPVSIAPAPVFPAPEMPVPMPAASSPPTVAPAPAPVAPPAPVVLAPTAPPSPASAPPAPAPPAAEAATWYIRPASGGQFGPADDTLIQQWATEGRIGADSYVWRTGWPDWRLASELSDHFPQLQQLPQLPQTTVTAPLLPTGEYNIPSRAPVKPTQASDDPSLATARYKRRKLQAVRGQQLIAVLLVCLTIVLTGVLAWVIYSTNNPASPVPAAPASATVDPPAAEATTDETTEQETQGADPEAMDANPPSE